MYSLMQMLYAASGEVLNTKLIKNRQHAALLQVHFGWLNVGWELVPDCSWIQFIRAFKGTG
jgi:hypothetical protein